MWTMIAFIAGIVSGGAGLIGMIADKKASKEYEEALDNHLEEKYGLKSKEEN